MKRCQMCRMIVWPWNRGDVADCKVRGFESLHERCIGYINESDWTDFSDYQRWDEANRKPGRVPLPRPWKARLCPPPPPQPRAINTLTTLQDIADWFDGIAQTGAHVSVSDVILLRKAFKEMDNAT